MKMRLVAVNLFLLLNAAFCNAQMSPQATILNIILKKYYKNEKVIVQDRRQLLHFYCDKTNNNEELLEAIKNQNIPKDFISEIKFSLKTQIENQSWNNDLLEIFANEKSTLKLKINDCKSLENYQILSRKLQLNNQRLLIVSKPIFYSKANICIIKVTFYRNIEHNNGVVLLFEKIDGIWSIKQELNAWET